MSAHLCKLCKLAERTAIEAWRVKEGLSHRQIHKRMAEELGIEVSLGTIAAHFKLIDAEVDEAVVQSVRQAAAGGAGAAMAVFPRNVEIADAIIEQLMPGDKVRHPQHIPYVAKMLQERRESALGLLRYTPADPANKAADALATWADVVRSAVKGGAGEDAESE